MCTHYQKPLIAYVPLRQDKRKLWPGHNQKYDVSNICYWLAHSSKSIS